MSVNIQTGNVVKIQSGNRVLISAPGPQGPAGAGGGVTDGDKGDITVTSSGATWTIDNQAVILAKIQHISTASLLGRHASGSGDVQQIGIDGGLELQGSNLRRAALTGDVTASAGSNTTTIANDAVTYAKMQDISSASRLLGRGPSGAGDVQELTIGTGLAFSGTSLVATGGVHPLVTTGDNGSGYGRIGLYDDDAGDFIYFQAGAAKIIFPDIQATSFSGGGNQITSLNANNISSGTLGVARGGTGATTLAANNVLLGNDTSALQAVAPGTTGNVLTSDGTTWTSTAPATTNPAGSGSELQFRSTGTAFGAVTNSSVSGGTLTLGNAEALATTPAAYLTLRNTTNAAAGAQQVSPSLVLEGRGWKTDATAASQTVRFRENILPVQGTANPSATWRLQSEINNSGTWTDRLTVTSSGVLTLGTFPAAIVMGNATIFGATNGPRFQVQSSDIFGLRGASGLHIAQAAALGWSGNSSDSTEPADLTLFRDAANILAQRNGTNAQTFRLYETDSGANDEYLELSAASGTNLIRPQATGTGTASVVRYHTTTTVFWTSGSGSPESVVTAPVGSLYTRTDGGAATTLYVKESGTGSTGWVAK